ncbi:MAG: DUF393 domain-containing protein [Bacteroidia bacterium]
MNSNEPDTAIILFDGVCNFCNASIHFIIKHDHKNYFKFATLQSEKVKALVSNFNISLSTNNSILLIEKDKIYYKSTAALRIAKKLNNGYSLLYLFIIVPVFIRNIIYDYVAKNRYKWFGKKEVCMLPSAEIRSKFIF